MDVVTQTLARRVRQEREARGWSLAECAERSGVSRAMISKIERAEASPTAELLNRLATALGLTLAAIFADPEADADPAATRLARRAAQGEWRDPATGYLRRTVTPPGAPGAKIVEVEFPAHGRVVFDTVADIGIAQQVWMLEGEMELTLAGETHRLAAGDCLAMTLSQPVAFANPAGRPARYAVVLARPEARR
nr:helix-turn-helix domain-containing protein [Azorhizobium doebereinerae]